MKINVRLLYAAAKFTSSWDYRKDEFEKFCMNYWLKENIANYMHDNFIDCEIPITIRFYDLDLDNQKLLLDFLDKYTAMDADVFIEKE